MAATGDGLVLYSNPMSRGRIARWMLEEIAEPYDVIELEYGDMMRTPEYLAINPMGKVPALTHGQHIVTEVAAICAYLADAFPGASLAPQPAERADYYRWLFFIAGPFEAAVTNRSLGLAIPAEKRSMLGYGDYESVMHTLDDWLQRHDYIAGKRFSAADVYVGSQIGFGLQFGSIDKLPAFEAYWARLADRPAYRRAIELDMPAS